jgi:hypothetical protein
VPVIVEGIMTTVDSAGQLNVAPMGPIVEGDYDSLLLRPFQTSRTFSNLHSTRCGVFHIVDTVDVIAAAAIGQLSKLPPHEPAQIVNGCVLTDCCRWLELQVEDINATEDRSEISTTIVHRGSRRPFFGFNRARHAVIEAAILATRIHLLERSDIQRQFATLRAAVVKTGGKAETEAFDLLSQFVMRHED